MEEQIPRLDCRTGQFVFASDWQVTKKFEFWRPDNECALYDLAYEAGKRVVQSDFIAFGGDSVASPQAEAWRFFDGLLRSWSDMSVLMFSALGNHDYSRFRGQSALAYFLRRFCNQENRRWFARLYGPLGLIFLDSNKSHLSVAQRHLQCEWYVEVLARFEAMPEVGGVIVFVHHPPYTNARLIKDNRWVKEVFVPPFLSASKTLLMVCGHVHSYERFMRCGKIILVAGGGGPRVDLLEGEKRRHTDDAFRGPAERPFHVEFFSVTSTHVMVEMRARVSDGLFETQDAFTAPLAPHTYMREEHHVVEE